MVSKTIFYILNAHHPLQYSIILWDKSSMVTAPSSLQYLKGSERLGGLRMLLMIIKGNHWEHEELFNARI
jgi:hypothetical protein